MVAVALCCGGAEGGEGEARQGGARGVRGAALIPTRGASALSSGSEGGPGCGRGARGVFDSSEEEQCGG